MLVGKLVVNSRQYNCVVEVREESETGKLLALFPWESFEQDSKQEAWDRANEYMLLLATNRQQEGSA